MWRKGNPSALLLGMQAGAATVENSMEFPQISKNGTTFRPVNKILSQNYNEIPLHTSQNGYHKRINKQVWEMLWRKQNASVQLVGLQLMQPLWKMVQNFHRKLKMELPFDTAIPLLGL